MHLINKANLISTKVKNKMFSFFLQILKTQPQPYINRNKYWYAFNDVKPKHVLFQIEKSR